MNRSGKVLIEPARFSRIAPDDDGKYLLARGDGVSALLDLNGKESIAPKWTKLEIDKRLNIIFSYDVWKDDEGETSCTVFGIGGEIQEIGNISRLKPSSFARRIKRT